MLIVCLCVQNLRNKLVYNVDFIKDWADTIFVCGWGALCDKNSCTHATIDGHFRTDVIALNKSNDIVVPCISMVYAAYAVYGNANQTS